MRVINVIVTHDNQVENLESFGVFEDQLSQDVVEMAEKHFRKMVHVYTTLPDKDIDSYIEDGCAEGSNGYCISLVWSDL